MSDQRTDEDLFDQNKENTTNESPMSSEEKTSRNSFSSDQENSSSHLEEQLNNDNEQNEEDQSSIELINLPSHEDQSSTSFEQIQAEETLHQDEENLSQTNDISSDQIDLHQSNENENQFNSSVEENQSNSVNDDEQNHSGREYDQVHSDVLEENSPEELKSQRDLDEEEIPPAIVEINSNEKSSEINSMRNDSTETETSVDHRPLTKLEKPFERDEEENHSFNENPSTEENHSTTDFDQEQRSKDHSMEQISSNEIEDKNNSSTEEILPPLSPTSIAMESLHSNQINSNDLSSINLQHNENQSNDDQSNELILPPIQLEKPSLEEIQSQAENPSEDEKETLPPLNSTSMAMEQINENHFNDQQISFQPSLTTTNHQAEIDSNQSADKDRQYQLENREEIVTNILPEPEDILGNKSLIKQILVKGKENHRPTRSTLVKISYQSYLVDQLTTESRLIEEINEEEYFVSECDLIPAIDISIQSMNEGEKALIDSDLRHCYGDLGWKDKGIPSASSTTNQNFRMKIHIDLHQWSSPADVQTLSVNERLRWGDKKRQMGNFYYQRQDYSNSLQSYRGALRFLDFEMNPLSTSQLTDEEKRTFIEKFIQIENNIAQVNLNLNRYQASLEAIENVLRYDQTNVKALFRQGKAYLELGKYDQALQPLKLCLQLQRTNSSPQSDLQKINEMISICETKLANYQKNEKEIYRRMFQPASSTAASSSPAATNQQRRNPRSNQTNNSNSSNQWLTYLALGSAALALVGLAVAYKYRKVS